MTKYLGRQVMYGVSCHQRHRIDQPATSIRPSSLQNDAGVAQSFSARSAMTLLALRGRG